MRKDQKGGGPHQVDFEPQRKVHKDYTTGDSKPPRKSAQRTRSRRKKTGEDYDNWTGTGGGFGVTSRCWVGTRLGY